MALEKSVSGAVGRVAHPRLSVPISSPSAPGPSLLVLCQHEAQVSGSVGECLEVDGGFLVGKGSVPHRFCRGSMANWQVQLLIVFLLASVALGSLYAFYRISCRLVQHWRASLPVSPFPHPDS